VFVAYEDFEALLDERVVEQPTVTLSIRAR
jgi:hypothetical protein